LQAAILIVKLTFPLLPVFVIVSGVGCEEGKHDCWCWCASFHF